MEQSERITTILIRSLKPKTDQNYTCIYENPQTRKYSYLTDDCTRVVQGKPSGDDKASRIRIPAGGEFKIHINKNSSNYEEVVMWFKRNPAAKLIGEDNPNLVIPQFEVVVEADLDEYNFQMWMQKVSVINKLKNMPFENLRDTAYAIGNDPANLTHKQLLNRLIGPTFEGDALLKKVTVSGVSMYAVNAHYNKKDKEMEYSVNAHKAERLRIITNENGVYVGAAKALGESIERVVEFFKGNPDFYNNYIVPQIEDKDTIDPELRDVFEKAKTTEYYVEKNQRDAVKATLKPSAKPAPPEPDEEMEMEDFSIPDDAYPEADEKRPAQEEVKRPGRPAVTKPNFAQKPQVPSFKTPAKVK